MIDDSAGRWSDAEPWSLATGGPRGRGEPERRGGAGATEASQAGEGRGVRRLQKLP